MAEKADNYSMLVRVYYEDTDFGGVVYYANYLKYMERARTELLRTLGVEQDELREKDKRIFVVKGLNINYIKPARFNALLRVFARPVKVGRVSLTFDQQIMLVSDSSEQHNSENMKPENIETSANNLICEAQVRIGSLHSKTFKPASIPGSLLEAFS